MLKNLTPAWNTVREFVPVVLQKSFSDGGLNRSSRLGGMVCSLRRRIHRLLWIYGVSWFVSVSFGLTLAIGILDWLVHLDAPVCRYLLAAAIVAVSCFVAWRFLIAPLLVPLSSVDLALRIERRFPAFGDSLVSAVQFLNSEMDSRIGSPELQQRVVDRAEQTAASVDAAEVIEICGVVHLAIVATFLCVACAVAVSLDPVAATTAIKRLYLPWSATNWPTLDGQRVSNSTPQPPASESAGPTLESLDVHLTPPAYTEKPASSLPEGVGHVVGFVGTRVDILAAADRSLAEADLCVNNDKPQPTTFFEDKRRFRSSFTIRQLGVSVYTLRLRDRNGLENQMPLRYQIRGIADQKPTVALDRPVRDLTVTAHAVVPLRIVARDDLKLKRIRLSFQRQQKQEQTWNAEAFVPLYSGDNRADRQADIDYDWDLSNLSLAVDEQVTFHAEATDFYDLGDVHVGRSGLRTLTVVTDDQKMAELTSYLAGMLDALDRIRDSQTRNMHALSSEPSSSHRFVPADVDRFKRIRRNQRSIASRLIDPNDGLQANIQQLAQEWTGNRLRDLTVPRQLETLTTEFHFLETELLPALENDVVWLSRLFSSMGRALQNNKAAVMAIHRTEDRQSDVIKSIDRMRVTLAEWRATRDLLGDLDEMIDAQQKLNRNTASTGDQTLAQPLAQLSESQRADLARLAHRQRQHAEQLDRLRQKIMQEIDTQPQLADAPPDSLQAARKYLDREATIRLMLDTADHINDNRVGQAVALQQTVMQQLRKLDELIRNPAANRYQAGFDSLEPNRGRSAGNQDSAGQRVANEQWQQLVTQLNSMITRQQEVIDGTARLATEKEQRGNWSRTQLKSLLALTDTQRKLERDANRLGDMTREFPNQWRAVGVSPPVTIPPPDKLAQESSKSRNSETLESVKNFTDCLQEASLAMKTAADRLAKRETDAITVKAETAAKQRLTDLVVAITAGNLTRTSIGNAVPTGHAESTAEDVDSVSGRGASQGNTQKKSSDLPLDATEQVDASEQEMLQISWRQLLSERVWGHLPPSLREEMDNVPTESTLPQYRDLIRAYYESLAKTNRRFGQARPVPKPRRKR